MKTRKQILHSLLNYDDGFEELRARLALFPWDSQTDEVHLSIAHVRNVLLGFLTSRFSAEEVEGWANTIESREDIGFEAPNQKVLKETIFELANPALTQRLTRERAIDLLKVLGSTL